MEISFILPAYNEGQNIESNVKKVLKFAENNFQEFEIIVVDDGSSDNTWGMLKKLSTWNPHIVADKNPVNLGPGAAFRRGFERASGEMVITTESDLSYPIEDTLKLIDKLKEGYDVVIASPLLPGAGYTHVPFFRGLISKIGTFIYTLFLGQSLTTYSGFFRGYTKQAVKNIKIESDGFESQVEIIWKGSRLGYKFTEVPSFQTYDDSRPSKFNVTRELMRHLKFLFFRVVPGYFSKVK